MKKAQLCRYSHSFETSARDSGKLAIACRHLLFAGGDQTKAYVGRHGQETDYFCEQCAKAILHPNSEGAILPHEQPLSNWLVICEDCVRDVSPLMSFEFFREAKP